VKEDYCEQWNDVPDSICEICKGKIKFENSIDITNGEDLGWIPPSKLIKEDGRFIIPGNWDELRTVKIDGKIYFENTIGIWGAVKEDSIEYIPSHLDRV
jgi:hypothetical protein